MESILLLNFTYEPMRLIDIKRAVKLLTRGKAEIARDPDTGQLHVANGKRVASEKREIPMPTIVRMLYYIAHKPKSVALTKKNVLRRDDLTCGYCGAKGTEKSLTLDHVQPRSRGGKSTWTNLVACCHRCNQRKANRTPAEAGMHLRRAPYAPRYVPTVVIRSDTYLVEWDQYVTLYRFTVEERAP